MPGSSLLDALPFAAVFVVVLLAILAAADAGYRFGRYRRARTDEEKEAPVGAMVGATLALLAFLLAITFGMAGDEFHARKVAVMEEANAIRTAYLRAAVIPEPQRDDVRRLLRDYVGERLQWAGVEQHGPTRAAKELLQQLWNHAAAAAMRDPSDVTALFIESVNGVIDAHAERVMVRERSRIPFGLWVALYAMAVLSLAAMGYHGGVAGTTRSPVMLAVALTFSMLIVVILDLDRPDEGWINVSQDAMLDLRAELGSLRGGRP
jgi:hypothetical protein